VSVHIGSQIRTVEPFAAALARVAGLVGELRKDGHDIRYVDAGGGLGIDYSDPPEEPKFDPARKVKDYAAAVDKATAGLDAHLLLEPGRFVVAQAGGLLTRVLQVKRNGVKTFVIVDCGDERPDPAGVVPGAPRDSAGGAAGPVDGGGRRGRARCASRVTSLPTTAR